MVLNPENTYENHNVQKINFFIIENNDINEI